MGHANGLDEEWSADAFEPGGRPSRVEFPQPSLDRLSGLAGIPAHYRPTFANLLRELFGQAHLWHRIATRSVEMDAAAKELGRIAKDAQKLKASIDGLSKQARATLGLHALRLDHFGEAGPHEAAPGQIEDVLRSVGLDQAMQKVEYLSWVLSQLGSAAAAKTWPTPENGGSARWKNAGGRAPHLDTFDRFVIELGKAIEACNSPVRFDPNETDAHLLAFLEEAAPYLPDGFVPQEVFEKRQNGERDASLRLKRFSFFGRSP
jgi:hypothetical protein